MNAAKKALEELSMDPEARRIASDRETAVLMHRHLLAASREAGRDEGRVEGEAKGRTEGLRDMLVRQLSKRFGPLPSWAEERVVNASAEQLEVYLDAVLTETSLESVLNVKPAIHSNQ